MNLVEFDGRQFLSCDEMQNVMGRFGWQVIPWFGFLQEISFFGNILVFLKKIDDSSLQNLQEIKLFGNVLVFLKRMNDSSTQNLSAAFLMSEADTKVSKVHRYHEISSRSL